MAFTVNNSILFSKPFVQYISFTAGNGQEPAASTATIIRNSFLGAPMTWYFNRNEISFSTVKGQQDYSQSFSANGNDFGFIEKASIADDQGNIWEIKDIYNTRALSVSAVTQRPSAVSVKSVTYSSGTQTVGFRFMGVPDAIYTVTLTYQKKAAAIGPFFLSAAAAGTGVYTGVFDPYSFPANSKATITGFTNAANNGTFSVTSCTTTTLTVVNASSVSETITAYATNLDWSPIPDQFSDVYNNLFLSEMLSFGEDDNRARVYRQRGIAAFLSRAEGLDEMQKNAFVEQWMARDRERGMMIGKIQQTVQSRGV